MGKYKFSRKLLLILLVLALILQLAAPVWAGSWQWSSRLPQGNTLSGVAFGNGKFVAVGSGGTILNSPDGVSWSKAQSPTAEWICGVTYDNGIFVAVGNYGTILTSPDGVDWTSRLSNTTRPLNAVKYGNGKFVAVGGDGTILTSPDGSEWTERSSGSISWLSGVDFANGFFVVVGQVGTLLTSADGINWSAVANVPNTVSDVVYGSSGFVVAGKNCLIMNSNDGINWTSNYVGTTGGFFGVTYGNGQFVAVGMDGTLASSLEGNNWVFRSSGVLDDLLDIEYGNGIFIAVGEYGTIITSSDGAAWTSITEGLSHDLVEVISANNTFIAVGYDGAILTSPDGENWTQRVSGTTQFLLGVNYGNGVMVAVGNGGTILSSPDGINWTERSSGTSEMLRNVVYGNGTFVAVGDAGVVLVSPDATGWTKINSGVSAALRKISFGNGLFVAVGDDGAIITSPDGLNWTQRTSNVTGRLHDIVYGNGKFMVLGGEILSSQDGVNWSTLSTQSFSGLSFFNGTFWAVGPNVGSSPTRVCTSANGVFWVEAATGSANFLHDIACNNQAVVAVGTGGTILRSDLTGITLDSASYLLKAGETHNIIVTAHYGGQAFDVTNNAVYLLTNQSVAIVNAGGVIIGQNAGNSVLKVVYDDTVAEANVKVLTPINSGTVSVDQSNKNLTITATTPYSTITVPNNVTDATVSVAELLNPSVGGMVTTNPLPALAVQAYTGVSLNPVCVSIPAGTTVSAAAANNWDGTINIPTVRPSNSVTVTADPGKSASVSAVIEVGFGDVPLTLSKAVRILIPGQAGKEAGYYQNGSFSKITNVMAADTQAAGDALPAGGDGRIDMGPDLVIWTKHFTSFVTYTQAATGSGGGGGGGAVPVVNPSGPVGKNGGTVTLNGATIVIPANAVTEDVNISVKKVKETSGLPIEDKSRFVSNLFEIVKDKSGDFGRPVTIMLPYDRSACDPSREEVGIFWLDKQKQKWFSLDKTRVDSTTGTVSGEVSHFTLFAVIASPGPVNKTIVPKGINFKDLSGHWAQENVNAMVSAGLINGYPDGTFKPDRAVTRAEFTTLLAKAFNLPVVDTKTFRDTEGHWARSNIAAAVSAGIVSGYGENTFGPDDPITREQMAVMVVKAAKIQSSSPQGLSVGDVSHSSQWALECIATAIAKGVIKGYPDNTFRPKEKATRAEAIAAINKVLGK